MSKLIQIPEQHIEGVVKNFMDYIKTAKLANGVINYQESFEIKNTRANLIFEPSAFVKMMALINGYSSEVAWHGIATRDKNTDNTFIISDILVYPQIVSAAHVDTDQNDYMSWLYNLDDDIFNNLKMQGHSHVNMGVTPSGTDLNHQREILDQLEGEMFYIFMIWNKSFKSNISIYDFKNNILFETNDIDVFIGDELLYYNDIITEAEEMVQEEKFPSKRNAIEELSSLTSTSYDSWYGGLL